MKKLYVSMLAFIMALSMLNGLLANERISDTEDRSAISMSFEKYGQNRTASPPHIVREYRKYKSGRYGNFCYRTWRISKYGAKKIRVHFKWIETQRYHDWVLTSAWNRWSGYRRNVWSSWKYGDTITVTLISDWSVTGKGFYIDYIEYEI